MLNSVQTKIAVVILAIFIVFITVIFQLNNKIVLNYIEQFESDEQKLAAERCVFALKNEIRTIDTSCSDWAFYDEAYDFVVNPSDRFIEANLPPESFGTLHVELIYFFDASGKIVWGKIFKPETLIEGQLKAFLPETVKKNNPFLCNGIEDGKQGLIDTELGPLLFASRPILSSRREGPLRGTLVFGKFLSKNLFKRLHEQTQIIFRVQPVASLHKDDRITFKGYNFRVSPESEHVIATSVDFAGFAGNHFRISLENTRQTFERGLKFKSLLSLLSFLTLFIMLHAILIAIKKIVIVPLNEIGDRLDKVENPEDFSEELFSSIENNEIGKLKVQFNQMMIRIKENALKAISTQEKFQLLFERMLSAAVIFELRDEEFFIKNANPAAYLYLKIEQESIVDMPAAEIFDNRIPNIDSRLGMVLVKIRPETFEWVDKYSQRTFHCIEFVLDSKHVCMIFWDNTFQLKAMQEKIELERKLEQARRMESLGVMAGGIAHDFNNILMGIIGNIGIMKEEHSSTGKLAEEIANVEKSAFMAADLVRKMLAYTGKAYLAKRKLNLKHEVSVVVSDIKNMLSSNIELELFAEGDHFPIWADQHQVGNALRSVIINSIDAIGISRKGRIDITLSKKFCEQDFIARNWAFSNVSEGEFICLQISDNGCGMTHEVKERLFEPFFSTKFTGRGLSMASAQGVLRSHNGFIVLESEVDYGTSISFLFPALNGTEKK